MDISIIGTGYVGLVTGVCFAEKGHRVHCVDRDREKIKMLKSRKMPIFEPGLEERCLKNIKTRRLTFGATIREAVERSRVIFICVPTPPLPDGMADLSFIEGVSREISAHLQEYRLIVDKSTVPVKTGERVKQVISRYTKRGVDIDVASNPEFLREGSAIQDCLHPDRIILGVGTRRAEMILRELYAPFKAPIIVTDIKSAELIKHASNSFLALKISFANALAAICELVGANVSEVTRGMGMDRRIGLDFLNAGIGYGGSCFPKDVEAFAAISRELGYDFGILREVPRINREARERFIKKIDQELWIIKGKRIGALGLSFKPDTDDIRESVAVTIIQLLQERGAVIRAYDPKAMPRARPVLAGVTFCKNAYEAARGADCLIVLTDWAEFKHLDFRKLKELMAHPTIIDGRNMLDPEKLNDLGFVYRSMGCP